MNTPALSAFTDLCQSMHQAALAENWDKLNEISQRQAVALKSLSQLDAADRPALVLALTKIDEAIAAAVERREQIATLLHKLTRPPAPG